MAPDAPRRRWSLRSAGAVTLARLAGLVAVAPATGCGPAAPPPPSSALLALGQSSGGDFRPFADGQDVQLQAGAQGGFHVWMSYRAAGMADGRGSLSRSAHRLSDDAWVLRSPALGVDLGAAAPPDPLPMFLCPSPVGIAVIDVPIVFEMALTDGAGRRTEAHVVLVPRCPDGQRAFCESICRG
jgi:hypothetical protein